MEEVKFSCYSEFMLLQTKENMPSDTTLSGVCDVGKHSGVDRNGIMPLCSGSIG